jgi:Protein involved in mRNA turnover and stability
VDEERARVVLVHARPLDAAELLEPPVAHPRVHRRERAQLVPDVLGGSRAEIVTEAATELVDDLDVVARLARRVVRLAHALHASLARGHRPLDLAQRRRRGQHDVGELGRARDEEVLDDEMVEPFEQALGALLVGFSLRRVLAYD